MYRGVKAMIIKINWKAVVLSSIFLSVLILNLLNYPFLGDDYVYAFMWQGQDIFTPLPENARRIQSFSDIFHSLYSHYFTWGGRMVAHFFVMLFMWVGKFWFDIANSFMVVLLMMEMQWIAHEGRITMDIRAGHVALAFFCLWAFNFDWCHTIIWLSGACNYLWAMVLLLLFLIPYIRHYFTDGEVEYGSWLAPVMFFLGLAAGDTNENTICWIGLTGIFYLWKCYRYKTLRPWMIAGFIGLSLGYGLLMLAPGNLVRLADDYKDKFTTHFALIWLSFLIQSLLWFYLIKAYRWGRKVSVSWRGRRKYFHLAAWLVGMAVLFNLIMLPSPAFYPRSTFPNIIFVITAVMVVMRLSYLRDGRIIEGKLVKVGYGIAVLYFCFTYGMTAYNYYGFHQYMGQVIREAETMRGNRDTLVIRYRPNQEDWSFKTGFHGIYKEFWEDEENWRNVAFAKYYEIASIRAELK